MCTNSSTPVSTPSLHSHSVRRHSLSSARRHRSGTVVPKQRIQPVRACASPRKALTSGQFPNSKITSKSPRKLAGSQSPNIAALAGGENSGSVNTSPRKMMNPPRTSNVVRTPKKNGESSSNTSPNKENVEEMMSPNKLLRRRHLTPRKRTVPPCSPSKLTNEVIICVFISTHKH